MLILGRLLTKMLLLRFFMILFGIVIFVLTLDIVTYSGRILEIQPGMFHAIGTYALTRSPDMINQFFVISILIAALLTLGEISRHSELVAVWNAGVSQIRIMFLLAPVALALGITHFLIVDQAAPRAAPKLHEWAIGDYSRKKLNVGKNDPLWMRSGRDIIRAARGNLRATHLEDLIIFRRDATGILTEQIQAKRADLIHGRWALSDVIVYYRSDQPPSRLETLIYSGRMTPAAAGGRSGDPKEMSIVQLSYFAKNGGFGIRPGYVYTTWWHKRLTTLFTAVLMLLIAVPLAHRYRRGGGLGSLFMVGIAFGFAFFIFDGIALTMGELGLLPSWVAAWTPIVAFSAAAATMVFRREIL